MNILEVVKVGKETTVDSPSRKAFKVDCVSPNGKKYKSTISPSGKRMYIFLNNSNLSKKQKEELLDIVDDFGQECYSRGTSD